jgi:diguanylate cyclase (GGDEF)-like protein
MLIIDIDHFKSINDQFGHLAGDQCLEELTKLLKEALRGSDFLARYGGEEFIAILPGTEAEGLTMVSERLRVLIEKARFFHGSHEIPFTISIGGSCVKETDSRGEFLFHRVDDALYEAKRNGRNRVVIL